MTCSGGRHNCALLALPTRKATGQCNNFDLGTALLTHTRLTHICAFRFECTVVHLSGFVAPFNCQPKRLPDSDDMSPVSISAQLRKCAIGPTDACCQLKSIMIGCQIDHFQSKAGTVKSWEPTQIVSTC